MIKVGLVPKFLTVTPDGRYLLVSNWCSFDLSVVDIATGKEIARLPMGRYPRGLAVSPDSRTAYVAIMGSDDVVKLNLTTLEDGGSFTVGKSPRHISSSCPTAATSTYRSTRRADSARGPDPGR